ncbi:Mu-like prophage protein gpG [Canicola haemoglobinophilus]|uniref:Mu-like prophage protein gpG n=1 Tax=Canicola haemoglobinophilus TaxID=733 RepID=A0AB38H9Y4_9PAST|nr:hypothetical protein [Canicola haemoglobinophilus]STO54401.1 Mu-like prophage protein gpG [Canicola haemoglobinophilus]STO68935.1 Mu-like prophage protein gpG [Canicola haemoglobinophilus]
MSVSLTSTKNGLEQLIKQLEGLNAKDVYVGIPASENRNVEGAEQFNLASLAAVLEFGNQHIPSRPFLRQTLAENQQKYTALFAEGINNGEDYVQLMQKIALVAQGDVQENIVKGDWVANAPSTIKRKGSSKPLIDTGRLRQSITGVIK